MKRKATITLLLISVLLIFTTGCTYDIDLGIEGVFKLTINKDYSADTEIDLLIDSTALNMINIVVNPLEELKTEFENQGYNTKIYIDGDKTGLYAYKHIENIEKLAVTTSSILGYIHVNPLKDIDISTEKSLFYDIYTVKTSFNLLNLASDYSIFQMIPVSSIIDQMKFKFMLDLPYSAVDHNASRVSEDNKILE